MVNYAGNVTHFETVAREKELENDKTYIIHEAKAYVLLCLQYAVQGVSLKIKRIFNRSYLDN